MTGCKKLRHFVLKEESYPHCSELKIQLPELQLRSRTSRNRRVLPKNETEFRKQNKRVSERGRISKRNKQSFETAGGEDECKKVK